MISLLTTLAACKVFDSIKNTSVISEESKQSFVKQLKMSVIIIKEQSGPNKTSMSDSTYDIPGNRKAERKADRWLSNMVTK